MRTLIRWAVNNPATVNTLIVTVMVLGAISLLRLRRETFPKFELDIVLTTVLYPGASPEEVERGVCQKIEESVRSIDGLKRVFSVAREGVGFVMCEMKSNVGDPQRVLDDVRSAVDRIPGFPPKNAEKPEVKQITFPTPAVRVAVQRVGDAPRLIPADEAARDQGLAEERRRQLLAERDLRALTEQIYDELLQLPAVSLVEMMAAKPYQIDVEVSEATLQKYGVSLEEVAGQIARQNIDLPAGTIKTASGEFRLSGRNQRLTGDEIARLQAIPGHKDLTVAQIGRVEDGFEDIDVVSTIDGQRAMCLEVSVNKDEDLLKCVDEVKAFVAQRQGSIPAGYRLVLWFDQSEVVRDRIGMLARNSVSGLVLVLLLLTIFLEGRLAFWVALGVPFSVLGACIIMLLAGETINMVSMFAILMALGILVDDAIVVGENIYKHRQLGKDPVQAAIDGTIEVAPSVMNSVATTIVAFIPLFFVSGVTGKFIAVMPLAIIAMLAISLLEACTGLPCHLAHLRPTKPGGWNERFRKRVERGIDLVIWRLYLPVLGYGLRRPGVILSLAAVAMLIAVGLFQAGITPFEYMPKLDGNQIQCRLEFADGAPAVQTEAALQTVEAKLRNVLEELAPGENLIQVLYRSVGARADQMAIRGDVAGHVGEVVVELLPTELRQPIGRRHGTRLYSEEIIKRWRAAVGSFPGAQALSFGGVSFAPGGRPIEFKIVGQDLEQLRAASKQIRAELSSRPGVFDVADDNRPGKHEIVLKKLPQSQTFNITEQELYQDVRARMYGHEVMRLQRGRHEVKLMVRHPPEERRSWSSFLDNRIPLPDGSRVPITELVQQEARQPYMEINRLDQQRSISVFADVDTVLAGATSDEIVSDLKRSALPELVAQFPGIGIRWQGQRQERDESLASMGYGAIAALLGIFVLLTIEFRSYWQPLVILAAIPFGIVGAVFGHLVMGIAFTIFSAFGLVTLAGVVVNDAIVLVDFVNLRISQGIPLRQALMDAGSQRFRAVFLTTVTTVGGLFPIVMERSLQAQVIIPMAVTLSFGLAMSTIWVLVLVPVLYLLYAQAQSFTRRFRVRTAQAYDDLGDMAAAWWQKRCRTASDPTPSAAPLKNADARHDLEPPNATRAGNASHPNGEGELLASSSNGDARHDPVDPDGQQPPLRAK